MPPSLSALMLRLATDPLNSINAGQRRKLRLNGFHFSLKTGFTSINLPAFTNRRLSEKSLKLLLSLNALAYSITQYDKEYTTKSKLREPATNCLRRSIPKSREEVTDSSHRENKPI